MTKSFIARLQVRPADRQRFIDLQVELKALTHAHEPGCLVYELLQSDEDENLFFVVATFRDAAAFDTHMDIDFHNRLVPEILACVEGEMDLKFYRSLGEPAHG